MMHRLPRLSLLAALLGLAACGHSPATTLLTLDAAPPPPAGVLAAYRGRSIAVPAVHLPIALDRPEYVAQVAPAQATVDDFAKWVAPLGTLARDTLVRDLTARLPAGAVLPPGATGGAGVRVIDVTLLSFSGGPGEAVMQVAFRALPQGPVRQVELRVPASAGGAVPGAQAFGALLGQLADRIVADLPAGAR
jgi:uncharacterized lipoprotein YmbA